jgi:DNA-binding response OmpR family regulator
MKARILVIEDMKEMGELIRLYLEKEGAEALLAETAEQGLEIFSKTQPDLIILDINLPGIDGFEFLHRLRRESNVPVMIVSARDSDEDLILGLGIGADEFVTKPFSPKVLTVRYASASSPSTWTVACCGKANSASPFPPGSSTCWPSSPRNRARP